MNQSVFKSLPSATVAFLSKRIAIIRILFGVIWAVDAGFKFEPAFYNNVLLMVQAHDSGEPSWLNFWFNSWFNIIDVNQYLVGILVIIIEVAISLSLIFGIARRLNYFLAAIFSFLLWAVAEGFGGPYVSGSTDVNAGIIYVMVFILLYVVDGIIPPSLSIDAYLKKHISWWHVLSDR
jgi:thiosulfate dehydrogenase [quinone] large subunit